MPSFKNIFQLFRPALIYGLRNPQPGGRVPSEITKVTVNPNKVAVDYALYYPKKSEVKTNADIAVVNKKVTLSKPEDIEILKAVLGGEETPFTAKQKVILNKSLPTHVEKSMNKVDFKNNRTKDPLLNFLTPGVGYFNLFSPPKRLVQREITDEIAKMLDNQRTSNHP